VEKRKGWGRAKSREEVREGKGREVDM